MPPYSATIASRSLRIGLSGSNTRTLLRCSPATTFTTATTTTTTIPPFFRSFHNCRSSQQSVTPIPQTPTQPATHPNISNAPPPGGFIDTMARKLRGIAPESTETYRAYSKGHELYLECARQAAYLLPASSTAKKGSKAAAVQDVPEEEEGRLSPSADFWYTTCEREKTFNSWAQVTILHMWTVLVRFRMFNDLERTRVWQQHLVDHFFFDAEEKMQSMYGITSGPQRSKYLKDLFNSYRGMVAAYDEGLAHALYSMNDAGAATNNTTTVASPGEEVQRQPDSDAVLAAAIWRNVFDAREDVDLKALGGVTAYVRRILRGLENVDDEVFTAARISFGDPKKEMQGLLGEN